MARSLMLTSADDSAYQRVIRANISAARNELKYEWLPGKIGRIVENSPRVELSMRHQGPVTAVAFAPDGKTVLTGSGEEKSLQRGADGWHVQITTGDNSARLWSVADGAPIGRPMAHKGPVSSVAFAPDGKTALTGSDDKTVRLWDAADGTLIGQPMEHQGWVTSVAFSPDGMRVLTESFHETAKQGDVDRILCKREVPSPEAMAILRNKDISLNVAVLSPGGKSVLTVGDDRTARLWDATDGKLIWEPMNHNGWVNSAAFSPDGKTILTGGDDYKARLWDAANGTPIGKPMFHERLSAVGFSADGRTVLTGSFFQRNARRWDATNGEPFPGPNDGPNDVDAKEEFGIRTYNSHMRLAQGENAVIGYGPVNGDTFLSWRIGTVDGSLNRQLMDHQGPDRPVVLSGDGRTILKNKGIDYRVAVLSPDGKIILTGGANSISQKTVKHAKSARLWSAADGTPIGKPMVHEGLVDAAAFSPDGRTVLTGSSDCTGRLWDATGGTPIGRPMVHRGQVFAVAFSPDGRTVLTGSRDKTAQLWDAADGTPIGRPMVHQGPVNSVAFAPDGRTVLTGSEDRTARIWLVPQPIEGDPRRIELWIQILTGRDLDNQGAIHGLDAAAWQDRCRQLDVLGGTPIGNWTTTTGHGPGGVQY